jgi:type VI secretion system protein ImpA
MAIDPKTFLEPVDGDDPCGPDLDLQGDMEFMNYMARAEGLLPPSYLSFDRNTIDFSKEFANISELSQRSHDLRLLVLFAKLSILNRDVTTFSATLDTIAFALEQSWNDIHPRSEEGSFIMRTAILQSLEDPPHITMPLQFAPLVENRRYGTVTFRVYLTALGKATPRPDETTMDVSTIERVLLESDIELIIAKRDEMIVIEQSAKRIHAASIQHAGYDSQVSLENLEELAREVAQFLDHHVASRDPGAAINPITAGPGDDFTDDVSDNGSGAARSTGSQDAAIQSVSTRKEAMQTLRAARRYFEEFEPSSPALMLVQYAETLMGKPFFEVVRILMPEYANRAAIFVGQNALKLGVGQIADKLDTSSSYDGQNTEFDQDGSDAAVAIPAPQTRRDAMRLLDLVVIFFRQAEPASPIPLLIARAREIGERDFTNLLKDLFNESVLRSIKGDDSY